MKRPLVITGTNTNVGKTTFARALLQRARERQITIAAMKPFCTGGREDAEILHRLQTADLALDEVNPFHFAPPVTPLIAAREAGQCITVAQTITAIERVRAKNLPLVIEGAGGLLSPLGEGFDLLDIIKAIDAKVVLVGANQLGVLNHVLMSTRLLDGFELTVVLMRFGDVDESAKTNAALLQELLPHASVHDGARPEFLDQLLDQS